MEPNFENAGAADVTVSRPPNAKGIVYAADQVPPTRPLVFSAIQHALLLISLGIALPVTVSRAIGLDTQTSTTFLCMTLLCIGISSILQSLQTRFVGCGYQSFAASDSAAISTCVVAAQAGGLPLVFGMTLFSGALHFVFSFFAAKLKRIFTSDVTGTMIFILGISLVPTTCKNFFSYASFTATGVFNATAVGIAAVSFLVMLCCSIFMRKLKLYAVLIGIVVGYVLSLAFGVLDPASFATLSDTPVVALPIPTSLQLSFDWMVALPYLVITAAGLVDNIGDFSAAQAANDGAQVKTNWHSIERGIRACGIGLVVTGLLGGSIMSTSTSNTGISKATGITSRRVVYAAGALLIALAFFPRAIGILAIIPEPVLGAALMFATCYIMASGFSILMECELDDRRIFLIFVSIVLATSTLIPGLFSFLPADISSIIVSPMVVGATACVFMKIIVSLGNKKRFNFTFDAAVDDIVDFNDHIEEACKNRAVPKDLATKLYIGIDALCESFAEDNPRAVIDFSVTYEETRMKVLASAANIDHRAGLREKEGEGTTFAVTLLMLSNMFDRVESKVEGDVCHVTIDTEAV